MQKDLDYVDRMWDVGEKHLGMGKYVSARRYLQGAERGAFFRRDARRLARIYLPLLETRRQIRYLAVEGGILISDGSGDRECVRGLEGLDAGTVILGSGQAGKMGEKVAAMSRRSGKAFEVLRILRGSGGRYLGAVESTVAGALAVRAARDEKDGIDAERPIPVPMPGAGRYIGGAWHALARESLLLAWEQLALRYQARHAPVTPTAWEEIAWLRRALEVDPACEPVSMRLMAVAEGIARGRAD